ncbi:MAG TPA: cyclic nucleotide-binding domain-containing protein [Gaiellaceae bacterium]|nr:cyclic nucleotide-binding domain-containing protein [Gaiellaceae bacterium]
MPTSTADELKKVALFSGLSQRQLRRLARLCKVREYDPGQSVVSQGHMSGICFFVIAEGEASTSIDDKDVGTLRPGDHFGELSLISGQPRGATVTAKVPMRCLVMTSWDFQRFVKDNPDVSWKLLKYLAELVARERSR